MNKKPPTTNAPTPKGTSMDYTKDIISIDDVEANEKACRPAGYVLERVHDGGRRYSHYNVVAFDADTRTGIARSQHGQLFVFRTRDTYATSGMVNATMWTMEDISLFHGTIHKEENAKAFAARVNSDFSWNPEKVESVVHGR
jgi:hypothetical protein